MLVKIVDHARQGTLISASVSRIKAVPWRKPKAWQVRKANSSAKFDLIRPALQELCVASVLDVGCNAGEITRLAGRTGAFSVGIDAKLELSGVANPMDRACLGNIAVTPELIDKLPVFESVLLLSVHHQFVKAQGDAWARDFVARLAGKASKCFFIEFAALNRKYSEGSDRLFVDNDEKSVVSYATGWLQAALPGWAVEYRGRTTAGSPEEHHRFMFMCVPAGE
jgi:hypothetical protein